MRIPIVTIFLFGLIAFGWSGALQAQVGAPVKVTRIFTGTDDEARDEEMDMKMASRPGPLLAPPQAAE